LILDKVDEEKIKFTGDIKIKISDFGLSRAIEKSDYIVDINKTVRKIETQVRIFIY
jgi:polyisoprenoid-binding protein YceI